MIEVETARRRIAQEQDMTALVVPTGASVGADETPVKKAEGMPDARRGPDREQENREVMVRHGWVENSTEPKLHPKFTPLSKEQNRKVNELMLDHGDGYERLIQQNGGDHSQEVEIINANLLCIRVRNTNPDGKWANENLILRRIPDTNRWEMAIVRQNLGILTPLPKQEQAESLAPNGVVAARFSMLLSPTFTLREFCDVRASDGAMFEELVKAHCDGAEKTHYRFEETAARHTLTKLEKVEDGVYRVTVLSRRTTPVHEHLRTCHVYELRKNARGDGWQVAVGSLTPPGGAKWLPNMNEKGAFRELLGLMHSERDKIRPIDPHYETFLKAMMK